MRALCDLIKATPVSPSIQLPLAFCFSIGVGTSTLLPRTLTRKCNTHVPTHNMTTVGKRALDEADCKEILRKI